MTVTIRQYELRSCGLSGGLVKGNTWRGLILEKDIGFKIASRVRYIEVRRAGDAAGERWANDEVIGRFRGHRRRWWRCEDVKVWRVGWSKHRIWEIESECEVTI